jgi:hypothetical protein
MVKGSTKTYGELMVEAAALTTPQEVGETSQALMDRFKDIIEDAVQKNHEKGVRGKYYIHIWIQKEPYAQNALRIYPQCRRTRPSPYQGHDHYLWSVEDGGLIKFQWCIPRKEIVKHILANPNDFDKDYVNMLLKYTKDKIENIDDYRLGIRGKEHMVG